MQKYKLNAVTGEINVFQQAETVNKGCSFENIKKLPYYISKTRRSDFFISPFLLHGRRTVERNIRVMRKVEE